MKATEERAAIFARCRSLSLEDYEITLKDTVHKDPV
jgi:hypothetical protein